MAKGWPSVVRAIPDAWIATPPARTPARKVLATRQYSGARNTNLTGGFGSAGNSSSDAELSLALTPLRARARQLMRDSPYAKRAKVIVVNNVIGAGIGLQAQVKNSRGELHARVNESIESAWTDWSCAEYCHTGGALHFSDLERLAMSEVFTAGEAFIRLYPQKFGDSPVPLALEVIESERLADDTFTPPTAVSRMGIEVDKFGRPASYWIRETHPGDLRATPEQRQRLVRVPADQIIHLRVVERWPQTRGEPWLHAVLRKLNAMDEYSGYEVEAARASSAYFATIESSDETPTTAETQPDGSRSMQIEPLTIEQLMPGETLNFHSPNRPNTAIDPFLRYMLREVAAGTGVSYGSISRDRSQANYSSERIDLLEDRDLWRVLQAWWIRSFRERLHKVWLQQAVLSRAISAISVEQYALNPKDLAAVRWKPRGWSWVDPTKEVDAYKEAVKAGFMTVSQVIAQTGGGVDIEDVIAERKEELAMFEAADIEVDTTVPDPVEPAAPASDPVVEDPPTSNDSAPPARVVSIAR